MEYLIERSQSQRTEVGVDPTRLVRSPLPSLPSVEQRPQQQVGSLFSEMSLTSGPLSISIVPSGEARRPPTKCWRAKAHHGSVDDELFPPVTAHDEPATAVNRDCLDDIVTEIRSVRHSVCDERSLAPSERAGHNDFFGVRVEGTDQHRVCSIAGMGKREPFFDTDEFVEHCPNSSGFDGIVDIKFECSVACCVKNAHCCHTNFLCL